MTGAEVAGLAVSLLALMAAALVFLRWPGRTSGMALALVLWVAVAPWAFWVTVGVVGAVALVWRVWRPAGGVGLLGHPRLAAVTLSGAGVVFARGWALVAALVALIGSSAWWWLGRRGRVQVQGEISQAPVAPWAFCVAAGETSDGCRAWVVMEGRCERCGGVLVATARLAGAQPGGAWATCRGCGARWAGVVDPARPEAGLVWLPVDLAGGGR